MTKSMTDKAREADARRVLASAKKQIKLAKLAGKVSRGGAKATAAQRKRSIDAGKAAAKNLVEGTKRKNKAEKTLKELRSKK